MSELTNELWSLVENGSDEEFCAKFDEWVKTNYSFGQATGMVRELIDIGGAKKVLHILSITGWNYGHDENGISEPIRWCSYTNNTDLENSILSIPEPEQKPEEFEDISSYIDSATAMWDQYILN